MSPPEYVAARAVLLDALAALGPHRAAVVLVGAQAVYQHCGEADFTTAPTTTDADLALAPSLLADEPLLADAMRAARFVAGSQPGIWLGRGEVHVDLLVPAGVGGAGGRRGARLPRHGNHVARRTAGLEAALVDNGPRVIRALDDGDPRSFPIRVAGPASLVVAKLVKIAERIGTPSRLRPKDGLDVLRLLRATPSATLGRTLRALAADPLAADGVATAVRTLREHAAGPDGVVPGLAADAERGLDDGDVIRMSVVVLADDVLREFGAADPARAAAAGARDRPASRDRVG